MTAATTATSTETTPTTTATTMTTATTTTAAAAAATTATTTTTMTTTTTTTTTTTMATTTVVLSKDKVPQETQHGIVQPNNNRKTRRQVFLACQQPNEHQQNTAKQLSRNKVGILAKNRSMYR